MEITEVRVKLVTNPSERLRAFCSVTLNGDFVIRDLKIIEGVNGVFVAMPSRKLADRCPRCGCKNHLRARFCNDCGAHLRENRAPKDGQGRSKLHADIAHPINAACRERIQNAVVEAYEAEIERSKSPDYKPQTFDDLDDYDGVNEMEGTLVPPPAPVGADEDRGGARGAGSSEFHEYDSLIADLKRDAADRRQGNIAAPEPVTAPLGNLRLPPSEGENAVGKPAYTKRPAGGTGSSSSPEEPIAPKTTHAEDSFGAGLV